LFSPESRKLLDYMDSITFTDITAQPPQPHLASLDSLSRLTSSVVSQDPVSMAAPSVQPAADGGSYTSITAPAEAPPSPATSSPKVIISHRRSRQRPNVEYVGQYPVSTINTTTNAAAAATSATISTASHNTTFTAVPHVHAIHSSDTATDLDAAIEQASYLNIQSILSRRPSDPAPTAMMAQEDPRLMAHLRPALAAARGSASAASLQSEWEMELTHTEIRRGGEHMQFAMDADALLNPPLPSHTPHAEYPHTDRYYAQHDPYNSGPHPPEYLRRSFDPKSAASRQPRKQQVNDKNWFSYDEGTVRSGGGGAKNKGNEMWFLFLKQKREAQMPEPDTLSQPQHSSRKVRPQSSDGVRRQASPVRPHSHTTTAGQPHYEQSRTPRDYASTLRQWPVHVGDGRDGSPTRRKEWSFDEPHRHYEPKQRPTSAGGRIRVSAQPPQQPVAMAAGAVRPSLSDALAEALQGLAAAENGFDDVQMPVQRVEEHQAVEPATTARRVHRDKKDSGRSHSRRQHREVKERLTATYMLG
jgi:hypothetical protein